MSIIAIKVAALAGSLFAAQDSTKEIYVGKDKKAKVVMTGYVGHADVKKDDKYVPGPYGRLRVLAAKAGEGAKERLVLELDGGLRGVLFKNKVEGKNYDYIGNIDAGDGQEFVVFGRKVKTDTTSFISLSSAAAQAKKESKSDDHSAPAAGGNMDDDIPF